MDEVTAQRPDSPGVIAFPPLMLLVAVALEVLLQWLAPWHFRLGPLRWSGALFVAFAVAVVFAGQATLRRSGTNVDPRKPALAIVDGGPFRFTRNPMYLGMSALVLGLCLLLDSWWGALVFATWAALIHQGVVLREERYLAGKFGEPYLAYQRKVRRWL